MQIYQKYIKEDWPVFLLFFVLIIANFLIPKEYIFHADTVQYIRAMEKFDPTIQQPQPPGYFLYILLARFFKFFTADSHNALLIISNIASGLSVIGIFYLAKAIFNKSVAYLSVLMLLSSPLFLFYGIVAQPYTLEGFLVIILGYICYQSIHRPSNKNLFLSAFLLGILGGFRQQDILFFLPIWIFSLLHYRYRSVLKAVIFLIVTILAWLSPTIILSHGFEGYMHSLSKQSLSFSDTSILKIGIKVLVRNYNFILDTLKIGLGSFFILSVFCLGIIWIHNILAKGLASARKIEKTKLMFFSLIIFPSLLFYLFIHINNFGHTVTFFPFVIILVSSLLYFAWKKLILLPENFLSLKKVLSKGVLKLMGIYIVGFGVILNLTIFVIMPTSLSYAGILKNHDMVLRKELEIIQKRFSASNTSVVIIAPSLSYGFNHASYYLKDYEILEFYKDLVIDYPFKASIRRAQNNVVGYVNKDAVHKKGHYLVFFNGCEPGVYQLIRQQWSTSVIKGIPIENGCFLYYIYNQ